MTRQSHPHVCPDDPGAFFAQLVQVMVYKPEPPPGWEECRVCGGVKLPAPEVPRFASKWVDVLVDDVCLTKGKITYYLCTNDAPWHPPIIDCATHEGAKLSRAGGVVVDGYCCIDCGRDWSEDER